MVKESVGMMGKGNAMWTDWYAREGAGNKEQSDESKR